MSNPQLPLLTGNDGELLTPRELEPSELADSDTDADDTNDAEDNVQDISDERSNAVSTESTRFRISGQLLFVAILVVLTAVFAVNGIPVGGSILLAMVVTIIPLNIIRMIASLFPTARRRRTRSLRRQHVASQDVDSKPDRIPHQLFYPLIAALWIGVIVVLGRFWPSSANVNDVTGVALENYRGSASVVFVLMILGCFSASVLVYVPAALFDRLFPTSTRLTMTETYRKSLIVAGKLVEKILNAIPSRGW